MEMNTDSLQLKPVENLPQEAQPEQLAPEEQQKVTEIAAQIDVTDSQAILQYGVGAQSQISSFSDSVLDQVRAKDAGYVGEILTNLMVKVNDLDVDSLSERSFISKIPIIGHLANAAKKFIARYQKLSVEIEKIISELDKAKMQLLKDVTLLDTMYDKNLGYLKQLDYFILAGEQKLLELKEKILPELGKKAGQSGDPVDAQKVNDMNQMIVRFEKKLHDLKLSRMISIQTAPQLRIIQNNDQVLVEKIQSSILNTIPLWKNQIVIAITLMRQQKALKLQKEVTDTTNELLEKNSEMLKQTSLGVAKESERGIVDIETLKKVNKALIDTIEETIKIQQEGRQKRQQAEEELKGMERELKDKLTAVQEK